MCISTEAKESVLSIFMKVYMTATSKAAYRITNPIGCMSNAKRQVADSSIKIGLNSRKHALIFTR